MRLSHFYLMLILLLIACDENNPKADDPAPEKSIVFQKVNADVSDIQVAREYSFDIHVNGTFDYEENYSYWFDGFNLTFPFYKTSYEAGSMPVISTRIYSSLMCRTRGCVQNARTKLFY